MAERLACSPPTTTNRVQSLVGSLPGFSRTEIACWTMPLVGGFSQGSPVSPVLSFRHYLILTSITLIGSLGPILPSLTLKTSRLTSEQKLSMGSPDDNDRHGENGGSCLPPRRVGEVQGRVSYSLCEVGEADVFHVDGRRCETVDVRSKAHLQHANTHARHQICANSITCCLVTSFDCMTRRNTLKAKLQQDQATAGGLLRTSGEDTTDLVDGRQADGLHPLYVVAVEGELVLDGEPPQQLHEGLAAHFGHSVEEHDLCTHLARVVQRRGVQRVQLQRTHHTPRVIRRAQATHGELSSFDIYGMRPVKGDQSPPSRIFTI
ncbi:hypothetical protein PR048_003565 [Dryococelus australis]|uniref:Uncharacterized protein n=1 Tax=Dryococelus australis TaxID=614101 RepID=A0ABQ9INE6_9NEOP|nr:hypothetical protein PR048_003565 [Dryococelus australis]